MTCPSLLRRRPAVAEPLDEGSERQPSRAQDAAAALAAWLRQDDALSQFARFVLVGGTSTAVYALLFLAIRAGGTGYLTAHLIATIASSMLANETHRRLTFNADDRVGWLTAQIEAGGVSFIGLVATSAALGWLDATVGSAHPFLQIGLVVTVTAVIGMLRFIALRWIFRPQVAEPA